MLSVLSKLGIVDINWPAQFVMLGAYVFMTTSFWMKKREKIFAVQIISYFLFATQYIMLGPASYSGAVLSVLSVGRAYFFNKKTTKDKEGNVKRNDIILYSWILIFTIASLITWDSMVSILALIATLVYTLGMWSDNTQNIRYSAIIASIFWISFNFCVGAYIGCILETMLFTSNILAVIKNKKVVAE